MAEKCIQIYKNIQEISAADVLAIATTAKHTTDTDNNTQKIIKTTSVIRSLTTETTQDHHICRSYENDDDTNNEEDDNSKTEGTIDDTHIQNLKIEQQKRKDLTILLKNNYVNNNKKSDQQSIFTTTIAVVSNEQEEDDNDNRESDVDDDDVNDDDRHHCIDDDSDSDIISTNSSIEPPSGREIEQMQFDCEKVEIYLETPVVDENNIDADITGCQVVDILNSAKPKRLSDEFFSADDGDDDNDEQEEEEDEVKIEKSNTVQADNNIAMIISCENIVDNNKMKTTTGVVAVKVKTNAIKSAQRLVDQSSSSQGDIINDQPDSKVLSAAITENNDVQSLNAIERMDFADEQMLTNSNHSFCDGILFGNNALISNNTGSNKNNHRLNLELISQSNDDCNKIKPSHSCSKESTGIADDDVHLSDDGGSTRKTNQLTTTPTSTRRNKGTETSAVRNSGVKLNLSANLETIMHLQSENSEVKPPTPDSAQQQLESISKNENDHIQTINEREHTFDIASTKTNSSLSVNCNTNKKNKSDLIVPSLSATTTTQIATDDIYQTTTSASVIPNVVAVSPAGSEQIMDGADNTDMLPSTSSSSTSSTQSSVFNNSKYMNKDAINENVENEATCDDEKIRLSASNSESKRNETDETPSSSMSAAGSASGAAQQRLVASSDLPLSTSSSGRSSRQDPSNQNVDDNMELANNAISLPAAAIIVIEQQQEHECDDDMWADCEEGSEVEEVCTCRNYAEDEISSEDELPSRDVDLSGYTNDDILQESSTTTPRNCRKRRITDSRIMYSGEGGSVSESCGKRQALDSSLLQTSPRSVGLSKSLVLSVISPAANTTPTSAQSLERRTPRLLIPTKDNPPPELCEWLIQFQRWSNAERLLAVDQLIDNCEPTQVRHMMKVIEPQFQRDFISLLPKELALQVLSFLQPKDLLRAAQTCRSWRFLADDNLLWKEKCKHAAVIMEPSNDRPKRGRAGNMPPISSAWKAAYIRQHTIEMNWRIRPIRSPKVLKGHDDHVITCLQFCGNRIVSGSDDNTLKVWSAITGKCLRTLVGHTGGVWSSQMAGTIIISGSTDRTLKVWNADSGHCLHTLYGHTSTVRCLHLHGNKVVSGSRDATLRVWDVNEGSCLHVLVGHLAAVRCVQYDGRLVVSGAYDYMVKVWNPERQECLHTLQGHTNRVYSLQFDGIHVVSGSLDTSIRVWDAETGSCKHTLMGHQSLTSGMELRSNILVSGNADSTVKVWDILTGQCLQTLSGPNKHQSAVTCLQFNSRFVITSSDDGTVKLWDVKTGDFIRNLVSLDSGGSGGVVWRIRANDTKLICAVGSRNGTEETKLMVLDFDVEGACLKCS